MIQIKKQIAHAEKGCIPKGQTFPIFVCFARTDKPKTRQAMHMRHQWLPHGPLPPDHSHSPPPSEGTHLNTCDYMGRQTDGRRGGESRRRNAPLAEHGNVNICASGGQSRSFQKILTIKSVWTEVCKRSPLPLRDNELTEKKISKRHAALLRRRME